MGKRGCQVHLQKAKMKTDLWERTGWKRQASSRWAPKWHQVDAETKSLSGPEGAWGISLFIFTYFEITFHIRMLTLRTCCGDVFGAYGYYNILYTTSACFSRLFSHVSLNLMNLSLCSKPEMPQVQMEIDKAAKRRHSARAERRGCIWIYHDLFWLISCG